MNIAPRILRATRKWLPCMAMLCLIKLPFVPYQSALSTDPRASYSFHPQLVSFEESLKMERTELGLGGANLNLKMRAEIGQAMSIALLGGFRGVVANFVWIGAHKLWEEQKWWKIKQHFDIVTLLQPRATLFWDTAAWHMAWNISYAERRRCDDLKKPAASCIAAQEVWIAEGRRYLEEGVAYNPDEWDLNFKLAWLITEKQPDRVCDAVPYYQRAAGLPGSPRYIARQVAFAQERCGDWTACYQTWLRLWKELEQNPRRDELPSVIWREGRKVEEILHLPEEQRFFGKVPESRMLELNELPFKPAPKPTP